jgi:hypothetical protein
MVRRTPLEWLYFLAVGGVLTAILISMLPARVGFDCRTIGRPAQCNRTPGCGFVEVYFKHPEQYFDPRLEGCYPRNQMFPPKRLPVSSLLHSQRPAASDTKPK